MSFTYPFPRPSVTVDLVALSIAADAVPRVLLIERSAEPFAGRWALPGGFLDLDEELAAAARRELVEETGLQLAAPVMQVGAFGAVDRDPRGRTIGVAFAAVLPGEPPPVAGGDDARRAAWRPLRRLPKLAFDHRLVLRHALDALALRARGGDGLVGLLPAPFTLGDLLRVHAALRDDPPSRAALARRLRGDLVAVPGTRRGREPLYRPASRHRSDPR